MSTGTLNGSMLNWVTFGGSRPPFVQAPGWAQIYICPVDNYLFECPGDSYSFKPQADHYMIEV